MSDVRKLYSAIIKFHNDSPFHFEKISNAQFTIRAYNQVCGDRFEVYVDEDAGKIKTLHFHGFGCAISKASASVLVKSIQGKDLSEALAVCNHFLHFLGKDLDENELILSEDFKAFSGVHDFPERYDCASLAWKEMKIFLESMQ